jgi:hypothetical protein
MLIIKIMFFLNSLKVETCEVLNKGNELEVLKEYILKIDRYINFGGNKTFGTKRLLILLLLSSSSSSSS